MLAGRYNAMRRVVQSSLKPHTRGAAVRTYVTVGEYHTRDMIIDKLDRFQGTVVGAPWGDYWMLVQDMPFWDAEWEKLSTSCEPWKADDEVRKKIQSVQDMMDCIYICEDVRDHINELLELSTRSTGLMGTGAFAGDKVDNIQEHAELVAKTYDETLEKYPAFKSKVDQSMGHGLALLRQKYKFNWSTKHRFFF